MPRSPKPWYRVETDAWYSKLSGARIRLADGKANRSAAEAKLRELLHQRDKGIGPFAPERTTGGYTFGDILHLRFAWMLANLMANTCQQAKWHFLRLEASSLGTLPVEDLKPFDVEAYLDSQAGWTAGTRRYCLNLILAAIRWAVKRGHIEIDPLAKLERIAPRSRVVCTGRDELKVILSWTRSEEFRVFLIALSNSGARPSELSRIEAKHLRPELQAAVLAEHKTVRKTAKPRIVRFGRDVWRMIERRAKERPEGPLFRTETGRAWSRDAINCQKRAIDARARKAGGELAPWSAYSLRHGHITDALAAGIPSAIVAELAGHSSPSMVERVYGHLDQREDVLRDAVNRLGGLS